MAHALDARTSYGHRRKSMPMELLRASKAGADPSLNRPPHNLWVVRGDCGAATAVMRSLAPLRRSSRKRLARRVAVSMATRLPHQPPLPGPSTLEREPEG